MRIVQCLWRAGRLNARAITEALNAEPGESPLAHSTVQTLLRQLEEKGAIGHEQEDRTFVYFAQWAEGSVKRQATRDFLDRLFGGSALGLASHLIEDERLSAEDLDRLKQLIEKHKEADDA